MISLHCGDYLVKEKSVVNRSNYQVLKVSLNCNSEDKFVLRAVFFPFTFYLLNGSDV